MVVANVRRPVGFRSSSGSGSPHEELASARSPADREFRPSLASHSHQNSVFGAYRDPIEAGHTWPVAVVGS